MNKLAFSTSAVSIAPGTTKSLGTVVVSKYSQIRVVAYEKNNGPHVIIDLVITEPNDMVAPLDTISLAPGKDVTRVYDIPGTMLTIIAETSAGTGNAIVGVYIYGWE